MNLAENIKSLIDENNLSIKGLERKAGLKINSVQNILNGLSKKPSAETLLAISRVFGCSIEELMGVTKKPPKPQNVMNNYIFEDHKLLLETASYVISKFEEHHTSLSPQILVNLTVDIYRYSIDKMNAQFNKDFADWMISKVMDG